MVGFIVKTENFSVDHQWKILGGLIGYLALTWEYRRFGRVFAALGQGTVRYLYRGDE